MRLIFLGDVVGRAGRDAVSRELPALRERYRPDLVVVNGENAAHGFGITEEIFLGFLSAVAFSLRPADPLGPWTLRRPGFVTPVDTGRDGNGRGVPGGRDKGGDHLLSGPSPREPSRPAKSQRPY